MAVYAHFYTIRQVSEMMQTVGVSFADETATIGTLLYDSRRVVDAANGLFFALVERRDGHRYIDNAYAAGVRNYVVSDQWDGIGRFHDANFIIDRKSVV